MANLNPIKLKERKVVAEGTEMFVFEKPADFTFEAGQYVVLMLSKLLAPDKRGPVRNFSISSAPCEPDLSFTSRSGESGFKQSMFALKPGDEIKVTKPIGKFTLSHAADGAPIVFLVGGIGITPVRSILIQAAHDQNERDFTVFYSNRFQKDAAFDEELRGLPLKNYRYITTLSQEAGPCTMPNEERGYICKEMIEKHVPDVQNKWFYLVGSPAFIEGMEKMLEEMGVPKERQESDPFEGLFHADPPRA